MATALSGKWVESSALASLGRQCPEANLSAAESVFVRFMRPMNICLVMFKEDGSRKEFPIQTGKTIIGRKENCDLRIPLGEISRQHAVLIVDDDVITLRDLGSANGTYVNNKRITEQELDAGDHLVIGPVVFTLQIDGEPADVKPVHTRLESRAGQGTVVSAKAATVDSSDSDFFLDDEQDPISELEALAASDETAAIDLDDSDLDPSK